MTTNRSVTAVFPMPRGDGQKTVPDPLLLIPCVVVSPVTASVPDIAVFPATFKWLLTFSVPASAAAPPTVSWS